MESGKRLTQQQAKNCVLGGCKLGECSECALSLPPECALSVFCVFSKGLPVFFFFKNGGREGGGGISYPRKNHYKFIQITKENVLLKMMSSLKGMPVLPGHFTLHIYAYIRIFTKKIKRKINSLWIAS